MKLAEWQQIMKQHVKSRNISTSSIVGEAVINNQPFEGLKMWNYFYIQCFPMTEKALLFEMFSNTTTSGKNHIKYMKMSRENF